MTFSSSPMKSSIVWRSLRSHYQSFPLFQSTVHAPYGCLSAAGQAGGPTVTEALDEACHFMLWTTNHFHWNWRSFIARHTQPMSDKSERKNLAKLIQGGSEWEIPHCQISHWSQRQPTWHHHPCHRTNRCQHGPCLRHLARMITPGNYLLISL